MGSTQRRWFQQKGWLQPSSPWTTKGQCARYLLSASLLPCCPVAACSSDLGDFEGYQQETSGVKRTFDEAFALFKKQQEDKNPGCSSTIGFLGDMLKNTTPDHSGAVDPKSSGDLVNHGVS